jgi:DNA-binding NarL/FixJ family response regulator
MSGSNQETAVLIDAMDFRRARIESFLAVWAKQENVDLVSIETEQAHANFFGDMDCRILIYSIGGAPCSSPVVVAEIQLLHALRPVTPLVIITDDGSLDGVISAINAGAQGYLDNAMRPALALKVLSFVLRGGSYFPLTAILTGHSDMASSQHGCNAGDGRHGDPEFSIKRSNDDHFDAYAQPSALIGTQHAGARTAKSRLTERQQAVMLCLCRGDPNKIIARKLGMTEMTVKVHVREIMRKLGVANRTQVAIAAGQNGHNSNSVADLLWEVTSDRAVSSALPH